MIRPRGVMICVPASGQMVSMQTMASIYKLGSWLTQEHINHDLFTFAAADIEDIRNLFVSAFYDGQPDCSHLLFVDADMGFPPQLVRDMIRFNKPLTGVLYARRQHPPSVVGMIPEGDPVIANGFMKMSGIGCGVMLIRREVITAILEKFPELSDPHMSSLMSGVQGIKLNRIVRVFDKIRDGQFRLSEDMAFCYRWHECGGEIWANIDYRISHVGPFDYALRYEGVLEIQASEKAAREAQAA